MLKDGTHNVGVRDLDDAEFFVGDEGSVAFGYFLQSGFVPIDINRMAKSSAYSPYRRKMTHPLIVQ